MASKAIQSAALLALSLLAPHQVQAQDSLRVGVLADRSQGSFPFAYKNESESLTGYEVALMERLCALADLPPCEWVELGSLEDHIALLVNGSIDASIGREQGEGEGRAGRSVSRTRAALDVPPARASPAPK